MPCCLDFFLIGFLIITTITVGYFFINNYFYSQQFHFSKYLNLNNLNVPTCFIIIISKYIEEYFNSVFFKLYITYYLNVFFFYILINITAFYLLLFVNLASRKQLNLQCACKIMKFFNISLLQCQMYFDV